MNGAKPKLPSLEWVRAFEAAARCGSFTAAAVETGLTQSAVSQRIGHLEKHLNCTLFHRRARAITLTVEGEAWLPHVRTALSNLQDSSEAIFGNFRRRLTLSASQSVIDLWLMSHLTELRDISDGELSVQTMVLGAQDLPHDDVIRIRYGHGNWGHSYKAPLYPERIAPMASPGIVGDAPHWTKLPRIACSGPRPSWQDWGSRFGIPTTPIPTLRFDTFLPSLRAALGGNGVFLGSLPLCREHLASGRLILLGDDILDHPETYWVVADKSALSRNQWDRLVRAICKL